MGIPQKSTRTKTRRRLRQVLFWLFQLVLQVKALKDEPYTQKEAEAAVGLRTDNGNRPTAQDVEVEMENSGLLDDEET
ncbi:zinc finger protein [Rutstroemia sp. NJR-2017a WRK4]|nr:zinc finger protein [Rutstroemia sp. NJR-2017a WRK4]